MGFFDDTVAPDNASSYVATPPGVPRITVRPSFEMGAARPPRDEVGEPPPEPGHARTAADASDKTEKAAPARRALFDDIVPPAGSRSAARFPDDASKEPESPPARTAGLFDDIVPFAPQTSRPSGALTDAEIPQTDPMTGMPMPVPRLAPLSPGLPIRPETQAPLDTPSSSWSDLPVMAPRGGVPLAVPDTTTLGEGFPAPPGPSAMDRITAAVARGFGDAPLGFSAENRAKYPQTYRTWQPAAAPLDLAWRVPRAAISGVSSAGAETYKALGGSETDGNRLERDLNILGQSVIADGGLGGRYNIAQPQANLFRTGGAAAGGEAAAARERIPRAGSPPSARPPDKAALQSDRMNSEARASGPSSFEDKEQHAPVAIGSAPTNSIRTAEGAESGPKRIGSFTPRADLKYGGTDFGKHAHREIGSMLQDLYKGVDLTLRVEPWERGVDVSVPKDHIARLGFAHADIKPRSVSGEKKLRQQILNWEYDPSTVQAITYDANGNVYFGFR